MGSSARRSPLSRYLLSCVARYFGAGRVGLSNDSAEIEAAYRSLLRPSWQLLGAVGYLGVDITALGVLFAACGHPIPIDVLVLGYIIGYLARTLPVPGGFGVLEAGLAGTSVA
jgi:uncharacterized membrane protein YbhN (UPF0104 family)